MTDEAVLLYIKVSRIIVVVDGAKELQSAFMCVKLAQFRAKRERARREVVAWWRREGDDYVMGWDQRLCVVTRLAKCCTQKFSNP